MDVRYWEGVKELVGGYVPSVLLSFLCGLVGMFLLVFLCVGW